MPAGLGAAGGRTPGPGKQQVWQAGPELMVTGTRQTATAEGAQAELGAGIPVGGAGQRAVTPASTAEASVPPEA